MKGHRHSCVHCPSCTCGDGLCIHRHPSGYGEIGKCQSRVCATQCETFEDEYEHTERLYADREQSQ